MQDYMNTNYEPSVDESENYYQVEIACADDPICDDHYVLDRPGVVSRFPWTAGFFQNNEPELFEVDLLIGLERTRIYWIGNGAKLNP